MPELTASPSSTSNCTTTAGSPSVPCIVDTTIIEFRPPQDYGEYKGQFGFDWLRVKESPTREPSYVDGPDETTKGLILGGYKDGKQDLTAIDAQTKWKGATLDSGEYELDSGEYDRLKIRLGGAATPRTVI